MTLADRFEAALGRVWWRRDASLGALLLSPLAWCYGAVTGLRRLAFAAGRPKASRAPVPVIVVGNLIAGGAGKTPTVIALVRALQQDGWTPGVISRGHGRHASHAAPVHGGSSAAAVGDEPLLIQRRTAVPVWVARRRIEAARALCAAEPAVDVLVADDGLQHLALARDVQVVVFDERGVGNGRLLPAGPLRQPLRRHVPVNTHVLYNAPQPSTPWPGAIAQRTLAGAVGLQDWWLGRPTSLQRLHALRGRTLLAAAGMAAPQRFFDMLQSEGLQFRALPLPDHFGFDPPPWAASETDVLVTEKDAVKLRCDSTGAGAGAGAGAGTGTGAGAGGPRIWVVALDFQLPEDFTAAVLHNLRLAYRP